MKINKEYPLAAGFFFVCVWYFSGGGRGWERGTEGGGGAFCIKGKKTTHP